MFNHILYIFYTFFNHSVVRQVSVQVMNQSNSLSQLNQNKKVTSSKASSKRKTYLQATYDITKEQLDTILIQLCQMYHCSWKIVATALYKNHHIDMPESSIRDRYIHYLDPKLAKQKFSEEEEGKIIKMFYLQGMGYSRIMNALGKKHRHRLRYCLEKHIRKGINSLEKFLKLKVSYAQKYYKGFLKRNLLVRKLRGENSIQWEENKYSLGIFYCFIAYTPEQLSSIPRVLAELLFQRLEEMVKEKYEDIQRSNVYLTSAPFNSKQAIKRQQIISKIERQKENQSQSDHNQKLQPFPTVNQENKKNTSAVGPNQDNYPLQDVSLQDEYDSINFIIQKNAPSNKSKNRSSQSAFALCLEDNNQFLDDFDIPNISAANELFYDSVTEGQNPQKGAFCDLQQLYS